MCEEMDILFLGRLFPEKGNEEIRKKAHVDMQDAACVLQWNLIHGLIENGCKNVNVISFLPIDSWPRHHDSPFIRPFKYNQDERMSFCSVGFCNITYVKQLLCGNVCSRAALEWARKGKANTKKVIVCYTCNNTLMKAVSVVKKKYPSVLTLQVVADLTEFALGDDLKGLRKLNLKRQLKKNAEFESYIDSYVLLTEQMRDKLKITKPYIVMEGIVPQRKVALRQWPKSKRKTILYTGSMNRKYGILELLKAFECISDPLYELVLCGLGNAEPEICQAVANDRRIKYLGKVTHERVLELQLAATVLVNPRQNNEEFTKYSFPSKTMEYLSSGVPLVAYKLDGIPNEYDEYISYVPDNSPESLAKRIIDICEMSETERNTLANRARHFVLEEKSRLVQTRRILNFIESL